MAIASSLYNHVPELLAKGTITWSDPLYLALLSSAYVFSAEHTVWADVSASEITGAGYTTGGFALSGQAVIRAAGVVRLDAADLSPSVTLTCRYGVVYANVTRNDLVKPLLKRILWDDTPADLVLSGGALPVYWAADGLIKMVVG